MVFSILEVEKTTSQLAFTQSILYSHGKLSDLTINSIMHLHSDITIEYYLYWIEFCPAEVPI